MLPLAVSGPLFGLIGVVVGGGITYMGQASLARRKEKSQAKAAARLVAEDIANGGRNLVAILNDPKHRWWVYMEFDDSSWQEHRDVLAARLDARSFQTVSGAIDGLRDVFTKIPAKADWAGEKSIVLPDAVVPDIQSLANLASEAFTKLEGLAGYEPVPLDLKEASPYFPPA